MKQLKTKIVRILSDILPTACPFERTIWGISIPPLCKLNPLYEDIIKYRLESYGIENDRSERENH